MMHLIIDGYNVIKFREKMSGKPSGTLQYARKEFLNVLVKYKGERNHRITVVFDGARTSEPFDNTENVQGIKVIYSRSNTQADDVIKKLISESSSPNEILVVSSDREIVFYSKAHGASTSSAMELLEKLYPSMDYPQENEYKKSRKLSKYGMKLWK